MAVQLLGVALKRGPSACAPHAARTCIHPVMLDVLVHSHVNAAMAKLWIPSQMCLQFEGAALQKRSSLSCGNCVAGWEFE
jgi:hypothetical protein